MYKYWNIKTKKIMIINTFFILILVNLDKMSPASML